MSRFESSRGDLPPLPKPYGFVSLSKDRAELEAPRGHDRYHANTLTGTLTGTITALSPVHVASGTIELSSGRYPLVKAHFRCGDKPTIPGSSLKGAIRSIVEAISKPPCCARVTHARFDNMPPSAR